ncbi:MAG: hypothetical protein HZA16_03640 [Nitrospirae bacterium]|nr:hypothetical protein [Nitrospirota bacterium]
MDNAQFDRIITLASKDTKRGGRVVAKIFYRMLRKKGFTQDQIISIATNILSCLTDSLKSYEQKVESHKEEQAAKKENAAKTTSKFARKNIGNFQKDIDDDKVWSESG